MASMAAIFDFRSELFSFFRSTSHFDTSNEVSSQLAFLLRRIISKYIFKMKDVVAILGFRLERF